MTKVRILVSQLRTNDGLYRKGEIVDFGDDKVKCLGSSVILIDQSPTKNKQSVNPAIEPEHRRDPNDTPPKDDTPQKKRKYTKRNIDTNETETEEPKSKID